MSTGESSLSIEETVPGPIPNWLFEHLVNQAIDPRPTSGGGPSKILVIYPNEESRREVMNRISKLGFAFDRNCHHTMNSLKSALLADLRLPRRLSTGPAFEAILHDACTSAAANLSFPAINPLPDMPWGLGKTKSLSELHRFLSLQDALESWDGPGIKSLSMILHDLERKLGGTHPDFVSARIHANLSDKQIPFTLKDIDGIIFLNHPPSFPESHANILLALSEIRPIHQLTNPGSFRLGHHGFQLQDKNPISSASEIPSWVPSHDIVDIEEVQSFQRVMLQSEDHAFDAALSIIKEELQENDNTSVLIVDPSLEDSIGKWTRMLRNLGQSTQDRETPLISTPAGFWFFQLCNTGHGTNSFSMEDIRTLSTQVSISPFDKVLEHPSSSEITPAANPDLISTFARSEHILGGTGALSRWLDTLGKPPKSDEIGPDKESTQWWLLSLSCSMKPLLRREDRELLEREDIYVGCYTGEKLPVQEPPKDADEWLRNISNILIQDDNRISLDGNTIPPAIVVQRILSEHRALRQLQSTLGSDPVKNGPEWVQEISHLIKSLNMSSNPLNTSRIRVMSPAMTLGCSSDLLIMANVSSSSWKLKVPKFAFLGDSERHSSNLLGPEGPIMDARHFLSNILHCSSRVIILDPSLDSSSPAAAPIREITVDHGEEPEIFEYDEKHPLGPRDKRQSEGSQLIRMISPERPPLNPDSISIPLDVDLQRDREARQPKNTGPDGHYSDSALNHFVSIDTGLLTKSGNTYVDEDGNKHTPRSSNRWPVFPPIDPRPLSPNATGSTVSDARHGHLEGPIQNVRVWSASRLQEWARCPRRGWLASGLRAREDESQSEDLDQRVHGDLMHDIHYDLLHEVLGMEMGEERDLDRVLRGESPISIGKSGIAGESLMKTALESLDSRARWLERTDATSTHWRKELSGMDLGEWRDWLSNPEPKSVSGRVGAMISSELRASEAMPIAMEWDISGPDKSGTEISLSPQLSNSEPKGIQPILVRGWIDRVDLLPHDKSGEVWVDEAGSETVAPLRIHDSGWKPRRLVAIRDLKTSIGKTPEERHRTGLLDELQLAIYSRAWEVNHPGDLVVGAGISLFGHDSEHCIEISEDFVGIEEIGEVTGLTRQLFRFADEKADSNSDPFRAWLAHRLSVALKIAKSASNGKVHPTPSKASCRYCPVKSACDVRLEDDF
ncbi:MAG: PD-(D/E)XK nuclease family protein [Candidatus Thermoplasmatota archaeon]|nr:PD-(D/E)XK nuclease family protein [Candidatus Thermoplasmatota archaeon]